VNNALIGFHFLKHANVGISKQFIFLVVVEEEVGSLEVEAAVVVDIQKVVEVGVVGSQKAEEDMDQGQMEEVGNPVVEVEEVVGILVEEVEVVEDIHLVVVEVGVLDLQIHRRLLSQSREVTSWP
jgi:hypothetical protein